MSNKSLKLGLLLLLSITVLSLTACGKDENDTDNSRPRTESEVRPRTGGVSSDLVEFKDSEYKVGFSYPESWGEPTLEPLLDYRNGEAEGKSGFLLSVRFGADEQAEAAENDESIEPYKFGPQIVMVSSDFQDGQAQVFREFVENPEADCTGLKTQNSQIVEQYKATEPKEEILKLLELNKFDCKGGTLAGQPALITYNPIQITFPPNAEEAKEAEQLPPPIPVVVPAVEYRAELPVATGYASILVSYLIFSDQEGTTYSDFNGEFDEDRTAAYSQFEDFLASLEFWQ